MLHGVAIADPYRWLEDQQSPATRAWIEAQNAYSRPILDRIPGREAIARRMGELMTVDTMGMPQVRGDRHFFVKRRSGQQLAVIMTRRGERGEDEVLVDPKPLSPDGSISAGLSAVSLDGARLAYTLRRGGEDEVEVRFLDVNSRKELPEKLPKGRYWGVSLKPDHSGYYYARQEKDGPRIYEHTAGLGADRRIFGDGLGPDKLAGAGLSDDGRYLLVSVSHGVGGAARTEIWVQNRARKEPLRPVVTGIDAKFFPSFGGDHLYLMTNWKAPNFRALDVDLLHPEQKNWRELIPEGKFAIEGVNAAGNQIFVEYLENAATRVKAFTTEGKYVRDIVLPAPGSASAPDGLWSSSRLFFSFTSFHIPRTIFSYDAATGKQDVWWRQQVPVDSAALEVKQVWCSSKDGTKIPVFLLYRKGLPTDGSRPVLLTGYGGFSASSTPYFDPAMVYWAERGGVVAQANLRGGGEFGESWHQAGMLERKQNVFDDFIAAAEWLVANRYTRPSKIAITGTSNGGLLVGAALTQRPDFFGAVVCRYPLLDMLRYQNFLVARWWVPEYGSAEKPEQFRYLYAYSPYHRVRKGVKYPAVLMVSGDGDTRVAPLHARKMAALLQYATASDKPVLLKYDVKAGHMGVKPVREAVKDTADELAFIMWQLGEAN